MKTIKIQCPGCNRTFEKRLAAYKQNEKRGRKTYCSRFCADSNSQKSRKLPTVSCVCTNCLKPFQRKQNDIKSTNLFCSSVCRNIHAANNKPLKEYFCTKCNKSLGLGWKNCRKTCDNCNSNIKDWSKITILDLKTKYDLNQFHARLRALSRTTYKNSDKPKKCCNCGYSTHYEVCHIKDVKEFNDSDSIATVNHVDNLVGLCRNCHWEFDNNLLKLSDATEN